MSTAYVEYITAREYNVLRLAAEGKSNEEIGRDLCIAMETVKSNLKNVYMKLGAQNRAHAVAIAMRQGIIH